MSLFHFAFIYTIFEHFLSRCIYLNKFTFIIICIQIACTRTCSVVTDGDYYTTMYRIFSNKRLGAYFLRGLQDQRLNITGRLFKAWCLFLIAYLEGTVDLQCCLMQCTYVVFECFLQETSDHGSDGVHLHSTNTFCEMVGLSSSILCSKRQSLDESQPAFA